MLQAEKLNRYDQNKMFIFEKLKDTYIVCLYLIQSVQFTWRE